MKELTDLLREWLEYKQIEDDARKARIAVEELIIARIGLHNHEGQKTHDFDGYKVTLKTGCSRKLDIKSAEAVLATLPEEMRPVKLVVDETGLKYLAENEEEYYRRLSPYVTVTPSKVGVKVEVKP